MNRAATRPPSPRRLSGLVAALALAAPASTYAADNYAEALQKSIYFYDAEKSGPGITGGRLEWRGDSEVRDGAVPLKNKGAGNVGVNIGVAAPMAYFPFSGWKDSFFGDLHGQGLDAVEFFTQKKVVVERWPKEWSRKF